MQSHTYNLLAHSTGRRSGQVRKSKISIHDDDDDALDRNKQLLLLHCCTTETWSTLPINMRANFFFLLLVVFSFSSSGFSWSRFDCQKSGQSKPLNSAIILPSFSFNSSSRTITHLSFNCTPNMLGVIPSPCLWWIRQLTPGKRKREPASLISNRFFLFKTPTSIYIRESEPWKLE